MRIGIKAGKFLVEGITMIAKLVVVLAVATAAFGTPVKRFNPRDFPTGGRIVGGAPAAEGEIPWQVSIQTGGGSQSCGGSIISPDWIITAAHCSSINPNNYRVRAGTLTYQNGGTVHNIEEVIVHESYSSSTFNNDIAAWRVSPAFEWNTQTGPIALPAQGTPTDTGTVVWVSGWGTTSFGGSISPDLLRVDVPIVSRAECDAAYGGIVGSQICAGLPEGGKDSCQGDSGGPLYLDGELRGIVSWGNGCAFPGYPGVYAEVSAHRDWISTNTGV